MNTNDPIILTSAHGRLRAGLRGVAWGPPCIPAYWHEEAVWVIWDTLDYPRWIPARKLVVRQRV